MPDHAPRCKPMERQLPRHAPGDTALAFVTGRRHPVRAIGFLSVTGLCGDQSDSFGVLGLADVGGGA